VRNGAGLSQDQTTGDHEFDKGSRIRIRQPQLSTKFAGSLFHATDAHANAIRLHLSNSLTDSLSIVSHGNHDPPFCLSHGNPHLTGF
jgi:hypothetical protein